MRENYKAIAWRSGAIDLHNGRLPRGAIAMFTFRTRRAAVVANRVIEANARHAYDGKTLLVPGIPEASTDDLALDALIAFCQRVNKNLASVLPKGSFKSEVRAA